MTHGIDELKWLLEFRELVQSVSTISESGLRDYAEGAMGKLVPKVAEVATLLNPMVVHAEISNSDARVISAISDVVAVLALNQKASVELVRACIKLLSMCPRVMDGRDVLESLALLYEGAFLGLGDAESHLREAERVLRGEPASFIRAFLSRPAHARGATLAVVRVEGQLGSRRFVSASW